MDTKLFKWSVSLCMSACLLVNASIVNSGGSIQILYWSKGRSTISVVKSTLLSKLTTSELPFKVEKLNVSCTICRLGYFEVTGILNVLFFFLNEVTLSDFILHQKVIIQVKIEILSKDITFIVIPSISTRVNVLKQLISNVISWQKMCEYHCSTSYMTYTQLLFWLTGFCLLIYKKIHHWLTSKVTFGDVKVHLWPPNCSSKRTSKLVLSPLLSRHSWLHSITEYLKEVKVLHSKCQLVQW